MAQEKQWVGAIGLLPSLGNALVTTRPISSNGGALTVPGGTDIALVPVGVHRKRPSSPLLVHPLLAVVESWPRLHQSSGFVPAPGGQGPDSFLSL